jgi:hypothetical protein
MRDAKASYRDAAARLDAFLTRAAVEFGSNEAETERRVDEHLRRQYHRDPLPSAAQT